MGWCLMGGLFHLLCTGYSNIHGDSDGLRVSEEEKSEKWKGLWGNTMVVFDEEKPPENEMIV